MILRRWLDEVRFALDESPPSSLLLPLALGVLVLASALGVIRVKHENRALTTEISQARVEREQLQMEWSQLQLEEAALSHHARIERAARENLGMSEPRDYVVVGAGVAR
ncbi:MAG: cell division protein FtsL [Panacagrimonas sp.]